MNIKQNTNLEKYTIIDEIIAAVTWVLSLIVRNRYFFFAFVLTAIFYLPALENGSVDAGFIYAGDVLGWYLPALAKTHTLLHSFHFTAIDYSTFGGSSDFFLSPNFFAFHPLVVIYCLIVYPETTGVPELVRFLAFLLAFHSFLACYFSLKLFTRFFSFEFGSAALISTVFAFSMHMVNAIVQPPFFLCVTIVPWAIYAALVYAERPNFRQLIFACLPIIFSFLGGYMPLAVASLALSAILVAAKVLYIDAPDLPLNGRIKFLSVAALPYVCASIIVGPYLYSVYAFHQDTSSAGSASLFYSAHQLAQLPQSLLQVISSHFVIPGRVMEFPLMGGVIVIAITAIFFLSKKSIEVLTPREWKIYKISALIYFATILAIFGDFSAVSDLVYYLVPQVGSMHIYERFLLPAQLLFGVMLALMLKALIQERPLIATRIAAVMFAIGTFAVAYLVAFKPEVSKAIGLNNYLVFELFLGFLFSCTLIIPGRNFVYGSAIVLILLPTLTNMYQLSVNTNTFESQRGRQPLTLDDGMKKKVVSYFKTHSDKAIIKYIDIAPMWTPVSLSSTNSTVVLVEAFPKVFPYYELNELQLSSYGGFTFYLSARADYMRKFPVEGEDVAVNPDWEYLKNTGADFLVARESDFKIGALASLFAKIKTEDVLKLPNDIVIVPLRNQDQKVRSSDGASFDNGYFKISPAIDPTDSSLVNIALNKPARESSDAGGAAHLAVDANTNGDFGLGSVTITNRDVNAWLEIDLGATEPIDNVKVWNRTDCCGYCLRDYWLFISNKPFKASDTAADLSVREGTWGQQNFMPNPKGTIETGGVRGRYVRVQLPGKTQTIKECFLSLAEIEIFRSKTSQGAPSGPSARFVDDLKIKKFKTDNASDLYLDMESSVPTTVEYLFWKNPRLNYYLNGQRANVFERNGLIVINVPPGHNTIEVRYTHWPLKLFWIFYAVYALVFLWVLTPTRFRAGIWQKLFHRAGDATN